MPELDQIVNAGQPAERDSSAPAGIFRGAFSSLRKKWRSKEHHAPVFFTASSIWLSVVQLISGVIIVRYVDPHEMGLYTSVSLALTYAFFVLAGVQNGLSRELPYFLGADQEGMARRLAGTTLFYTMGGSVLSLVGGAG